MLVVSVNNQNFSEEYSDLIDFFYRRTRQHIHYVKQLGKIVTKRSRLLNFSERTTFELQIESHDSSKFVEPEFKPYVLFTASKNNDNIKLDSETEEAFNKAWIHHYSVNKHHPEYWVNKSSIQNMTKTFMLEMCCDWAAMSLELGDNLLEFSRKGIKKYKFTQQQVIFLDTATQLLANIIEQIRLYNTKEN